MNTIISTHPDIELGSLKPGNDSRPARHIPRPRTAFGRATLEEWIREHPSCSDAGLRHVVSSLVAACLALQRSTGRSHGALKVSRIIVGDASPRRLVNARIEITGPRAPAISDRDQVELADLRAIGGIIVQLVEGRVVESVDSRTLRMGESWRELISDADFWFLLCRELLDADLSLASINLASLALEFPFRRRQPALIACAVASCALALSSAALYVAQPSPVRDPGGFVPPDPQEHVPAPDTTQIAGMLSPLFTAVGIPDVLKPEYSTPVATNTPSPPPAADSANRESTASLDSGFIPITIEAEPGSLAAIVDAHGVFTSIGLVGPNGRLARDVLVAAGTYELTLEHHNHATSRQSLTLQPGQPLTLQPEQPPMPGSLRIASLPAGAEVRINGIPAGMTPLSIDNQPSQRELTIELALPGHEPATRMLRLEPREIRVVDFGTLVSVIPAEASEPDQAVAAGAKALVVPERRPETGQTSDPAAFIVSPVRENSVVEPVATRTHSGPGTQQAWTIPDLALELQWIGPGEFLMGSPASETGRRTNEHVQTPVRIAHGFWIGRFEVSQAQYSTLMKTNPSAFDRAPPQAPVEQVSWEEAVAFCLKLTERERAAGRLPPGYEYALPTEQQWEYACRAGTSAPWPGSPEQMAWFEKNARKQTHAPGERIPVPDPFGTSDSGPARFIPQMKSQQPNNWGLHDMLGNVAEWCRAAHEAADSGVDCIVRGGSWRSSLFELRSAHRAGASRDARRSDIGFRIVLAPAH